MNAAVAFAGVGSRLGRHLVTYGELIYRHISVVSILHMCQGAYKRWIEASPSWLIRASGWKSFQNLLAIHILMRTIANVVLVSINTVWSSV